MNRSKKQTPFGVRFVPIVLYSQIQQSLETLTLYVRILYFVQNDDINIYALL